MPKRNIIWILVAGVIALLLWKIPETAVRRDALYNQFRALLDVRVQVLKHYVDEVEHDKLLKGAIDGMLNHLDPYCAYFDSKEYEQFNKRTKGQFYGIGIEVTKLPGEGLLVVSPIEGSPAFQAGLQTGDRITGIDGVKTDNMPLPKGVELIAGKPGTSVNLTVFRPATDETFEKTITRGLVTVRTVRGWARDDTWDWDYLIDPEQRIGYVRISGFEMQTAEQFDAVIRDLLARHHMRGLVLDLRDNPGGLLDVVVTIANRFIAQGRIVSTKRRVGPEQVFMATSESQYPSFPLAVVINGGSASASEILAGCLRDHGRATLVGERTFGKGSVQELIELENGGGAVKLTTAYYYLPNGERIHGHGVAAQRVVDLTPQEKTELLESQMAVFSTSISPTTGPHTQPATATATAPQADPRVAIAVDRQLREALDVVRGQLATMPAE
jgi:carboxyl-terminal processing protease